MSNFMHICLYDNHWQHICWHIFPYFGYDFGHTCLNVPAFAVHRIHMLLLPPAQAFLCLPAAVPVKFLSSQPVIMLSSTCTPTDAAVMHKLLQMLIISYHGSSSCRSNSDELEQVSHVFPFVHIPTWASSMSPCFSRSTPTLSLGIYQICK